MLKKMLSCILIMVLFCCTVSNSFTSFADSVDEEISNEYIVVTEDEETLEILKEYYNDTENHNVSDNAIVLSLTDQELEEVALIDGTRHIEENIILKQNDENVSETNETPNEVFTENIKMISADDIEYQENYSVKVGILDSGIADHKELNVSVRNNLIDGLGIDNNLLAYDLFGHGTGISGVIGAKKNDVGIIGICENIELCSIQVLDTAGEAPLSRIVEGIDWAIENDIDVLNMSFGTNINSEILHNAIIRAYDHDIVLVASAGNTSDNTQYPAKYPEVIAVGSVNGNGEISDFSADDEFVDIYAPGEGIVTTGIFDGYITGEGTSFAAPHVTAAAAIVKMFDKNLNSNNVRNIVKQSAGFIQNNPILNVGTVVENLPTFDFDNEIENIQTEIAEPYTYDSDSIVTGNWNRGVHYDLAYEFSNGITGNNLKLVAASAYMADELYGVKHRHLKSDGTLDKKEDFMQCFYPLHAFGSPVVNSDKTVSQTELSTYNSNFLADTKYLYRLAVLCYNSSSLAEAKANVGTIPRADANVEALQQIVFSNKVIYTNPTTLYVSGDSRRTGLDRATHGVSVDVKGIAHMNVYEGITEDTPQKIAYKVLGLALHLAGDTYAHRVRVPTSSTESGGCFSGSSVAGYIGESTSTENTSYMNSFLKERKYKSTVCKCFNCFKSAVARGRVEFRDLSKFIESDKYNEDNSDTDPDKDFYVKRYTIATKHATNKLMSRFVAGEGFTLFVFLPSDTSYKLKLNCLRQYVDDTSMDWDGLQPSTQERVLALSTGGVV